MLEDIAILTGGTMVSSDLGVKLENVTIQMLGQTKKVMIEKENTTGADLGNDGLDGGDPNPRNLVQPFRSSPTK